MLLCNWCLFLQNFKDGPDNWLLLIGIGPINILPKKKIRHYLRSAELFIIHYSFHHLLLYHPQLYARHIGRQVAHNKELARGRNINTQSFGSSIACKGQ